MEHTINKWLVIIHVNLFLGIFVHVSWVTISHDFILDMSLISFDVFSISFYLMVLLEDQLNSTLTSKITHDIVL